MPTPAGVAYGFDCDVAFANAGGVIGENNDWNIANVVVLYIFPFALCFGTTEKSVIF